MGTRGRSRPNDRTTVICFFIGKIKLLYSVIERNPLPFFLNLSIKR